MINFLGVVGPMGFVEHAAWFCVLSLFVFLVYNGLRTESIATALRRGLRRWLAFVAGSIVLALVSGLLASYL